MHALIWHESAGDPWSFSVPSEVDRRTYRTLQDALTAATAMRQAIIRVGLAGLPVNSLALSPAMFMPCANLVAASRELGKYMERCNSAAKPDATSCAIAAYHGSWERPDERFAMAVRASVSADNVPNFEVPEDALPAGPAGAAKFEISNRWQKPKITAKGTGHFDNSPAVSRADDGAENHIQVDHDNAQTIIVQLDESAPAMFMQLEMNVRQQLFATSKR
jgi:hypothetical protein